MPGLLTSRSSDMEYDLFIAAILFYYLAFQITKEHSALNILVHPFPSLDYSLATQWLDVPY